MATPLTVNNVTYQYPQAGDDPGWGEAATGWAVGVTQVLGTLVATGDILTSTFAINNDVTSATSISGLIFDPSTIRSAEIEYSVYRRSDSTTSGNSENGKILLSYDNDATAGNKWLLSRDYNGESGVEFDIVEGTGQLQYTSSDIGSTNYSGTIKFKATTFSQ